MIVDQVAGDSGRIRRVMFSPHEQDKQRPFDVLVVVQLGSQNHFPGNEPRAPHPRTGTLPPRFLWRVALPTPMAHGRIVSLLLDPWRGVGGGPATRGPGRGMWGSF